jgi:hypothetical protein
VELTTAWHVKVFRRELALETVLRALGDLERQAPAYDLAMSTNAPSGWRGTMPRRSAPGASTSRTSPPPQAPGRTSFVTGDRQALHTIGGRGPDRPRVVRVVHVWVRRIAYEARTLGLERLVAEGHEGMIGVAITGRVSSPMLAPGDRPYPSAAIDSPSAASCRAPEPSVSSIVFDHR